VNDKPERASYAVKIGDVIEVQLGSKPLRVEVVSINEYAKKEDAPLMYKVLQQ